MIEWLHDPRAEVILDTRHHPAVISTFRGSVSVDLVDGYFGWSDAVAAAAMAEEQLLVHVTDLSDALIPAPLVRKRVIEHNFANLAGEVSLAHIVVVPSLGLRTVVRTIARLSQPHRRSPELLFASTLEEGLELALRLLWKARIPPPPGLDPSRYETPVR